MSKEIKIGIIGLDTSHTIEFTKRFQAPDCPKEDKVSGVKVVTCMRFDSPFQKKEGLDERQKQMEKWGVKVTLDFNEAVKGVDAVMLELNDPAMHLEYFRKAAMLGVPVYLDKPLADNAKNGREIMKLMKDKNVKVFSASSLRFSPDMLTALNKMPKPLSAHVYGPLGIAAAGSSIVWYGVHAFERLERIMGRGAQKISTTKSGSGVVITVEYPENKRGVVELNAGAWVSGGDLRMTDTAEPFVDNSKILYTLLCREIAKFLQTGKSPVDMEDTMEIMAMLDAAERSFQSGKEETIEK